MDPNRFIPRLEEVEGRFNPAGLTPDMVFAAAAFARYDEQAVDYMEHHLSVAHAVGNQARTEAVANEIISLSPGIEQVLSAYVVELQTEKAAASPSAAGFFNQYIAMYGNLSVAAQAEAAGAQAVLNNITAFNAALSAAASGTSTTGTTGTTTTGVSTGSLLGGTTGTTTTGTTTTGTTTTGTTTTGTTTTGSGTGTGGTGTSSTGTTTPGSDTTSTSSSTTPGSTDSGTNGTSS